MDQSLGQIIIINGPSSGGKTSTAKALQEKLPQPYLHFRMDLFWDMLPAKASSRDFPDMKFAMIESAAAIARQGYNVILDVACGPQTMALLQQTLYDYHPFTVAVTASLECLRAREKARGDRNIGLAESQLTLLNGTIYDLTLDTTNLTAENAADFIIAHRTGHAPKPPTPAP